MRRVSGNAEPARGSEVEAIMTIAATSHGAGNVMEELMGQLLKMTLEMQHEQHQWMEVQEEK